MSLFETVLKINGYPIESAKKLLSGIKGLSGQDIEKYQDEKRWQIFKEHFNNNPSYNSLCNNKFPESWDEVPIMKKRYFQNDLNSIINSKFKEQKIFKNKTAGSSGTPLVFVKDKFCHALTWAVYIDRYSWWGIKLGDKQARFWGIAMGGWPYYEQKLKDILANRQRFVVNELSDHVLEHFINKLKKSKFKYIYGYTNALLLFARYLNPKGISLKDICPTLKCCIITSEACSVEEEQYLQKSFGIDIVNEYGSSEIGLIAFPDRQKKWRLSYEDIFVEILDDDNKPVLDGEKGRIVITSLYNQALPFIRYELGDIAAIEQDEKGFKVLKQLYGRLNDTVRLPSGKVLPGATLHYASKVLMENIKGLKEYNIKQTALDTFEFEFVADGVLDDKTRRMIEDVTSKYLEPGLNIKINKVPSIKRTAAGKFKHFQSFIDTPEINS